MKYQENCLKFDKRNSIAATMTRIRPIFGKIVKMERTVALAIFCIIFSTFVSESSSAATGDQGGYFLFTPPFGGDRPPQEVTASKRSGAGDSNDVGPIAQGRISPAETLWIGSHKINWSPLPLFQKFLDHHHEKQQQRSAQARKFDSEDHPRQKPRKSSPFAFGGGSFKEKFSQSNRYQKKPIVFHNPHHDFSNKITSGGFFAGLNAAFGKTNAPPVTPPRFAEPRISNIPSERDYDFHPSTLTAQPPSPRGQPTTPIPQQFQSSTRGTPVRATILVSPPEAIRALSTPGPSISPIIDRLRQMTEWSKQSQKSIFIKKEGKPNSMERKLRLKKRIITKAKPAKHNIEAIILSNDDDDFNDSVSVERNTKRKSSPKSKRKSRGRNVSSREENNSNGSGGSSSEEADLNTRTIQTPESDIVVINPTNAALLQDPLDVQQSALKHYQLMKRQDKKIDFFSRNDDTAGRSGPVSFRFGAEDAKVNPYTN